jgi:hypothetical protein
MQFAMDEYLLHPHLFDLLASLNVPSLDVTWVCPSRNEIDKDS